MTKAPELKRTSWARIRFLLRNREYRRLVLPYILGNMSKAERNAKKILAENKEDTYALDVLAKVNARKKNWTQSRRLFFRIMGLDPNHINIQHQVYRTSVYSGSWDYLVDFLKDYPELLEHEYYIEILHKKLSRWDSEERWKIISNLSNSVQLPHNILYLWSITDQEICPAAERLAEHTNLFSQVVNAGIHGRHSFIYALSMRDSNEFLQQMIQEIGLAKYLEFAALSGEWNNEKILPSIRDFFDTYGSGSPMEYIENMSKFIPILEIIQSGLLPAKITGMYKQELLELVDRDLPHRLNNLVNQNKSEEAMEIVETVGHLWKDESKINLWTTVSRILIENGHLIKARRILERLILSNPTNVNVAHFYHRTFSENKQLEKSLVSGEIASHLPGMKIQAIEAHADTLCILNEFDQAEDILYPVRNELHRRGHRLRMQMRFYEQKDPLGVVALYLSMPEKIQRVSEFSAHYSLSLNELGKKFEALESIEHLTDTGEANGCLTAYDVLKSNGEKIKALKMINKHLTSYGYAPFTREWVESDFSLDKIRIEEFEPSSDQRLVSVIMTAHKYNPMMDTAVYSVLNQSHSNLELLIIDDASEKEDVVKYQKYLDDSRVKIIRQDMNSGTYPGRNRGLSEAKGEFISFIDSDDWQHPQKLEKCLERLDQNEKLIATLDSYVRLYPNGNLAKVGSWFVRKCLMGIVWKTGPLINTLGGFDEVRVSADSELLERAETIFGKEAIQHIPVVTYIATYHEDSLTGGGKFSIGWKGIRGPRAEYVANFRAWHSRNKRKTEKLKISSTDEMGKFPVPEEMPRNNHGFEFEDVTLDSPLQWITDKDIGLELKTKDNRNNKQEITICMATFPGRFTVIKHAVQSLLNQTLPPDKILIHVNESDEIPKLPNDPRIIVSGSSEENITDIGKFKLAGNVSSGIVLTVDDDIHYPEDYIETMVNAVNRYDGEAIIGVHGCVLPVGPAVSNWNEYRKNRRVHWFRRPVSVDLPVNIVGTGTMGYDASKIAFDWTKYQEQRMVDIHVAVEAQRKGIPMITPSRKRDWMAPIDPDEGDSAESIWDMVQTSEDMQNDILRVLQSIESWTLNLNDSRTIRFDDLNFLEK
ncbi:MAG: glycosyltransferase family 2 protein [Candidatus Thermoplasmatota archaeon]|nr:glycosyltransferase family 2 protein [Candidatus Thermoplasmatota archaeon]